MAKRINVSVENMVTICELSKNYSPKYICQETGLTRAIVNKIRFKFKINDNTSTEMIDRIIIQVLRDAETEKIDYNRQEKCSHPHLCLRCDHCKLAISEQDIPKMRRELDKHETHFPKKYITEQTI